MVSGTISRIFSDQVLAYLRTLDEEVSDDLLPEPGEAVQYLEDGSYLYLSDFYQFLNRVETLTGNPDFGWDIYKDFDFRNMGIMGYAIVNSTHLKDAISVTCDYVQLVQSHTEVFLKYSLHHPDCMDLCYRVNSEGLASTHDTHMSLGFFIRLIQYLCNPDWSPVLIGLTHSERKQDISEKIQSLLLAEQPFNFVTIENHILEAQIAASDQRLYDIMCSNLNEKIDQQSETLSFFQELEDVIFQLLSDEECGIDKAAEHMCMSRRTLQRRLADHDVSFSYLVDNVRRHFACQLLHEASISMIDIALTLGYSELAAFNRAFKRWHGITPTQYRELFFPK